MLNFGKKSLIETGLLIEHAVLRKVRLVETVSGWLQRCVDSPASDGKSGGRRQP